MCFLCKDHVGKKTTSNILTMFNVFDNTQKLQYLWEGAMFEYTETVRDCQVR